MEKRKLIKTGDEYIILTDQNNEARIFATDKSGVKRYREVLKKYSSIEEIPEAETLDVFELQNVGEKDKYTDYYDIVDYNIVKLPIKRITWPFVKLGKT